MANSSHDKGERFIYLLNAMEHASQAHSPYMEGYDEKRKAVLRYVEDLHGMLACARESMLSAVAASAPQERQDAERVMASLCQYAGDEKSRRMSGHIGWIPLDLNDLEVLQKAFYSPSHVAPISVEFAEFIGRLSDLVHSPDFWADKPYGNRLYYGQGAGDYIAGDILQAFLHALKLTPSASASQTEWGRGYGETDATDSRK